MEKNLSIQGLRGLVMLVVLLAHVHDGSKSAGFAPGFPEGSVGHSLYLHSHRAVDVFFLLSGFVIPACIARHGAAKFLVGRAKRVYPTFLVPHLLIFGLGPFIGYKWLQGISPGEYAFHFLSNLLFLPGIFPLPIAQGVAWTLSYEIAFYLLAATAYALWQRPTPRGWLPKVAKLGLWGLWLGISLSIVCCSPRGYECWYFVAGVLAHAARDHLGWRPQGWWFVTMGPPAALVLMCLSFFNWPLLSPLFGVVFVAAVAPQRGWTATLLRTQPMQYLGDISYSFYLWHAMVLFGTKRLFVHLADRIGNEALTVAAFGVVSLVMSLAVAHVSYRVCEQWLTSKLSPRKTARRTGLPFICIGQGTAAIDAATAFKPTPHAGRSGAKPVPGSLADSPEEFVR